MNGTDELIRQLYSLVLEAEWNRFRAQALERVCASLGVPAAAWLTHVPDHPGQGEFTVHPPNAPIAVQQLLSLPMGVAQEHALGPERAPPGARHGTALSYSHHQSPLASLAVFWFPNGTKGPGSEALRRVLAHLAESSALALRQFILRDERLSRMGRSNRGTAALVDTRGTVYSSSYSFRDLISGEFKSADAGRLPFALPDEAFTEQGLFSRGSLRFRAVKTPLTPLYLLYARKAQPLDDLSPREQEIARVLSAGKTFKSVARQCGIAVSTVANHAARIYRKLGIYRREELVELVRRPAR